MSKWEDSFNKKTVHNNNCYCSNNNGLFIPNRQLSALIAGLLFLFFGCFIVGYFFGKQSYVEQFTQKMCQESFSDQIYSSAITANDFNGEERDISKADTMAIAQETISAIENSSMSCLDNTDESEQHDNTVLESTVQFYAQLIGFGTEKAAQKFVQKLALRNIETLVKKRTSKTAKGRTIYWYQVITPPYSNKETLTNLVNKLAKEERLSGIYIGSC